MQLCLCWFNMYHLYSKSLVFEIYLQSFATLFKLGTPINNKMCKNIKRAVLQVALLILTFVFFLWVALIFSMKNHVNNLKLFHFKIKSFVYFFNNPNLKTCYSQKRSTNYAFFDNHLFSFQRFWGGDDFV